MSSLNTPAGPRNFTVSFAQLPQSLDQLRSLPEAALREPYHAAALLIPALCRWPSAREEALEMIQFLKGPTPLSPHEIRFITDRLLGKAYLPFSFFNGATPENGYEPARPHTLVISENPYSYQEQGYAKLYLRSGGADSPRPVQMRLKPSSGEWFLWEQMLLSEIRQPTSADPWA